MIGSHDAPTLIPLAWRQPRIVTTRATAALLPQDKDRSILAAVSSPIGEGLLVS